jgi:hypothetical protein
MVYSFLLPLHNLLRWLLLAAALFAVIRAAMGGFGKKDWSPLDDRVGFWFTMVMDLQVLVGLILYLFFSPLTLSAFQNFSGAMQNLTMRFFAVEHIGLMIVALALAHIGRVSARKASDAPVRHRRALVWFGLALLAMLLAIPWPFSGVPRPWIRF